MNIPIDCADALEIVLKGHSRAVDAGLFNGKLFLNIGGMGFDAAVVEATQKMKWLGSLSYYAAVFRTLIWYRARRVRLWIDDVMQEQEFLMTAVGNGRFYGGGMKVLPESDPSDGKLDVCTVDSIPPLKIAALFPQFPTGGHVKFPFVKFYRCAQVRIESLNGAFSVQTDGEVYSGITAAHFSILPAALRVLVP
jgi:diacylglycerol kinase family enzyme